MAVSDEFLEFVLGQLSSWGGVSCRRMFGGAGLYRDGTMFGLVADDVAYLKVDDTNRERFTREGSKPFKPYPDKPHTMSYCEVPAGVLEQPELFVNWAEQSYVVAIGRTLKKPSAKKKKGKKK